MGFRGTFLARLKCFQETQYLRASDGPEVREAIRMATAGRRLPSNAMFTFILTWVSVVFQPTRNSYLAETVAKQVLNEWSLD